MSVPLTLEATQPRGKTYRLGFGCNLHLAWMYSVALKGRPSGNRGLFSYGTFCEDTLPS